MMSLAMDMVAASQVKPCFSKLCQFNMRDLSRQFGLKPHISERQARFGFHCQAEAAQDTAPSQPAAPPQPFVLPYENIKPIEPAQPPAYRKKGVVAFIRILNKAMWREQGTKVWHKLPPIPITNVTRKDVFEVSGGSIYCLKQLPNDTCRFFEMNMGSDDPQWVDKNVPPALGDVRCNCVWNGKIYIFTQSLRTWVYNCATDQWFCSDNVDVRPYFAYSLQRTFGFADKVIGDFGKQLRVYDTVNHRWTDNYGTPKDDRLTFYCGVGGRIVAFDREGVYEVLKDDGTWEQYGKLKNGVCEVCFAEGNEIHVELYNGMHRMEMDWENKQLVSKEDLSSDELRGYAILRFVRCI